MKNILLVIITIIMLFSCNISGDNLQAKTFINNSSYSLTVADDTGNEIILEPGEQGVLYFSSNTKFTYDYPIEIKVTKYGDTVEFTDR